MDLFSSIGSAVSGLVGGVGDVLEGVGAGIGIGGKRTSAVSPAYIPEEAAFLSSPEYQAQMAQLQQEIDTPRVGPSAAEIMAQREGEKAARGAASVMASSRANPAIAAKQAAMMGNQARQEASGQASVIRAQEDMANRQFREQQRGMLMGAQDADRQALMNRQSMIATGKGQEASQRFGAEEAAKGRTGSFISGLGQAGTTAALMSSDINLKENIQDGSSESQNFLEALEPYAYNYKDPQGANGERLGVMAQDIEKTPMNYMVKDTPQGKMVDYGQGFGAILAAVADMHGRVKELEAKKGKK
jgi:hypothetical protein